MNNAENEILKDFIEESKELLQNIEDDFLQLEKNPTPEITNSVFRAIHTIKGGAGFVGMQNIGKLAHIIENILSKVREGIFVVNSLHINVLLAGVDELKKMINNIETCNSKNIDDILSKLENIEKITENHQNTNLKTETPNNLSLKKTQEQTTNLDTNLVNDFVFEAKKYLVTIENSLDSIFKKIFFEISDELQKTYKALDVLSGTSKLVGLNNLSILTNKMSVIIKAIQNKKYSINESIFNSIYNSVDKTHILIDDAFNSNNTNIDEIINELNSIDKNKEEQPSNEKLLSKQQDEIKKQNKTSPNINTQNDDVKIIEKTETVRLNVNILDKLMQLAGELVLVRNQQLSILENSSGISREVIQRLNSITTEIQETVMQTRLQPIGVIFNKFPRVVRELSLHLNKKIELVISGSEVELDKTIIESIAAPLVHLIRNSADHGIELPEIRLANGKPAQGTISLNAVHESGFINITISDDGKGIDAFYIKQKVLEKGLKPQLELDKMTENELLNLIFLPGFSTSQTISDISGRGVGMDVVKNSIEKLSGFIDFYSVVNKGTTITLKLPLTLAIIPCLIVGYGKHRFALPQLNIDELVTIFSDSENRIENTGEQEVYRLRNKLIPIVRLNEILNQTKKFDVQIKKNIIKKYHEHKTKENSESTIKLNEFAIISYGNHRYGLVFDSVIGSEEIVVKPLHHALKGLRIFSGVTILGDGKIAPILDVEGVANHTNIDFNLKEKIQEQKTVNYVNGKIESILLFKNGTNEQFAMPVSLLKRIEPIKSNEIEYIAGKEFITINSVSHRIIRLENMLMVSPCVSSDELYLILIKYVNRPVGILFSQLIDIQDTLVNINTESYKADGIIGTSVINKRMTLFIDAYRIIEMADPELYDQNLVKMNKLQEETHPYEFVKILVVDDSTVFRQMINNYLTHDGFEVTIVSDGASALKLLNEQKFDLMISDLEMPNMSGFELIETVRASSIQKNIPSIALSSNTNEKAIETALKSGFNEYLIKIDKEQLISTIKKIIYKDKQNVIIYEH